jgi:hypothetical protein
MPRSFVSTLLLLAACAPDPGDTDTDVAPVVGCAPTTFKAPPACGTGPRARGALIAGEGDGGYDATLAAKARRHDRLFRALFSAQTGVNSELTVPLEDADARAAIDAFVAGDGWDFEAVTGRSVTDTVGMWTKVAGGYAGVGIAADAFRYGVLRDEGAPCAEVDEARAQVLAALDGLHRASAITGVPGVIARGYARNDVDSAGSTVDTVPLFDDVGAPLPVEKTNGTWRADNSGGLYPDYVWEDSCSRDMLVGWAFGYGGAWEVIAQDPTIAGDVKARMQADAAAIARSLLTVQASGYDLEVRDADGRMTLNGALNENSIDTVYLDGVQNGPYAMMSLGILSALSMVAQDAEIEAALNDTLIAERRLHEIARDRAYLVDFGNASNFSNYNMDFAAGILGERYLCDADARKAMAGAVDAGQYEIPGRGRQPAEQGQTLYDLAAVLARLGGGAWWPSEGAVDQGPLGRGLATLTEFPDAPFWANAVENCDADEIAAGACLAVDGTPITLMPTLGRGDVLTATEPVPMRLRPASNYHWRSNPYAVNGDGDGTSLYPGVDFRVAYWPGRWVTPQPRE